MFRNLLPILMKLGLISDEMVVPRDLRGFSRIVVSIISVAFSYFFVHISYFGPPRSEIFKGVYILATATLCVLVYKGRQRPVREGFAYLDEIFSFLAIVVMCATLALWAYWGVFFGDVLWGEFMVGGAYLVALLGALFGAFLYRFEATTERVSEFPTLSDWLYIIAAVAPIIWWNIYNIELTTRIGGPVPASVVIYTLLLTTVSFDIARRVIGPVIPFIGFLFLIYSFKPIAQISPGLLYHEGFGLDRVTEFLMLEADGITGLIVEVFATYIVIFVVLGAFLEKTGLGEFLIDATYRVTGQKTGGPGLTAVMSSGLFGMISGSGVANVVTTGTFTIPLMKRVGYRPEFAGAVEAAASTGGAYMPPIMAGGAFLVAQLTETSYFDIVKIATLPAILYYLSVGYMVFIRAVRRGLHGVDPSELPPWSRIIPRLHFLLPIPVMVYYLVIGDSAFLAAFKTICLIVMLKTCELLSNINIPTANQTARPFLAVSIAFGVFSYYFGLTVGAPFSWFADTLRGMNWGDALFWTVAAFIVLKLAEIISTAMRAETGEAEYETGPILFRRLWELLVDIVKVTWISLEAGARNTLVIGCIACVLGILLSCATQSDLSGRISILLTEFSFGLLPLTIIWVIIAGYIVGMGLPITASYVVLVIFGVIALTNLGVPTVHAHLICFWVAVVSAVTPPVALAAYAASAIAVSDPVKTGFQALKLASWLFIMPFLFVYTPLLLDGTTTEVSITFGACVIGIVGWAGWMENFMIRYANGLERALMFIGSTCLLLPVGNFVVFITPLEGDLRYLSYAAGIVALAAVFVLQRTRGGEDPAPA